jgi:hypothetical protein
VGITNSKPPKTNHYDPPIRNIDLWSSPIYYTLFWRGRNCVVPFTSCGKLHEFDAGKQIFLAKPTHFDILMINFTVWSHIQSTGEDALSIYLSYGMSKD